MNKLRNRYVFVVSPPIIFAIQEMQLFNDCGMIHLNGSGMIVTYNEEMLVTRTSLWSLIFMVMKQEVNMFMRTVKIGKLLPM